MPSQNKWDEHWMRVAWLTSRLSKDPSTKVGSCIVSSDNRQISIGYNGFAAGLEETYEKWNNRNLKHELVVHSEINAVMNCPFNTNGCSIYVTHQPCHRCMPHLRNAGIQRIIYNLPYTKMGFPELWKETAELFRLVRQIDGDFNV